MNQHMENGNHILTSISKLPMFDVTMDTSSRSLIPSPPSSPAPELIRRSISSNGNSEESPGQMRRAKTVYPPVVSLMVESNTMRNCHQIQSMVSECQQQMTNSNGGNTGEPFVCRTAKKYHAMCLSGERN